MSTAITPIIAIDRNARTPLHRQIYDGYRGAVVNGTLRPGQRVPSTRGLAAELGVSRIPVLGAYAQLMSEGYFQSRVGAGTTISLSLPDQKLLTDPRRVHSTTTRTSKRPRKIAKRPALPESIANPPWRRGWVPLLSGRWPLTTFPSESGTASSLVIVAAWARSRSITAIRSA